MTSTPKSHMSYLDPLRILACFLVIVNHTNPSVYTVASPNGCTWYASMLYHYLCRMAVPLFLMISGACLLHKRDTWKKVMQRILRIALLLLLFSTVHYLLNIPWNEPVSVLKGYWDFLKTIWQTPAVGAYWYLYLYMALLLLTPFLQSMVQGLRTEDFKVGLFIWLIFGSGMLLLGHYCPGLVVSSDFLLPMFSDFVCCMAAGYYVCHRSKANHPGIAACVLLLCIVLQTALTRLEYNAVSEGSMDYLFLDWRIHPAMPMLISALCMLHIGKAYDAWQGPVWLQRLTAELSACSLCIYMIHSWIIEATRSMIYQPLSEAITALPAVFLWECVIFAVSALISILLRRLPLLRRLL